MNNNNNNNNKILAHRKIRIECFFNCVWIWMVWNVHLGNAPDGQQFLRWTLCPYFKGITYVSQMSKLKILTYNQDLSFFSTVLFPNISCKSTVSVYHFSFLQIWRLQKFFSKSEYRPACLLERFIKQTKPACSYEMAGNFKWVKLQHIMRSKRH